MTASKRSASSAGLELYLDLATQKKIITTTTQQQLLNKVAALEAQLAEEKTKLAMVTAQHNINVLQKLTLMSRNSELKARLAALGKDEQSETEVSEMDEDSEIETHPQISMQ